MSEFFRIKAYSRRWDAKKGKFIINISYETAAPEPTERVIGVADAFGLGVNKAYKFILYDNVELKIGKTDIVYITGDSGSGKSVLLKALERDIREDMGQSCRNIEDIKPDPDRPIVETVGKNLSEALELLSRVALTMLSFFSAVTSSLATARNTATKSLS